MYRDECLDTAKGLIATDRAKEYGSARENFERTAELWAAYLSRPVSTRDVVVLMSLLKVARLAHLGGSARSVADSFVDICGYAALGCELETTIE